MLACAVLGASAGCYDVHYVTLGDPPESEEIVPPCTEADAGADADADSADASDDAAEDAPADAPTD